MEDITYIVKDDKVNYNQVNYKGLREEVVTAVVRESMVNHGLIVFPVAQVHTREPIGEKGGVLSIVDTTYRFVDTEDSTSVDVVSSGSGADTQDKGVGKAMTYAYKYLFLRTFAIPTGEDPDKVASAQLDDEQDKRQKKQSKKKIATDAPKSPNKKADAPKSPNKVKGDGSKTEPPKMSDEQEDLVMERGFVISGIQKIVEDPVFTQADKDTIKDSIKTAKKLSELKEVLQDVQEAFDEKKAKFQDDPLEEPTAQNMGATEEDTF